jgi:hypothetical protein
MVASRSHALRHDERVASSPMRMVIQHQRTSITTSITSTISMNV